MTHTAETALVMSRRFETVSREFSKLKEEIRAHYMLNSCEAFEYCAAVYLANKLDTNPVWGFLIGPPSKLKTDFMELFYEIGRAHV